jgi:hypothetical protein
MKTLRYLLIISILGLPFERQYAQVLDKENATPRSQQKVHREYDENGNLIEYDSSAITTWSYSSSNLESDSIPDYWSYTPAFEDSTDNEYMGSRHYGFRFPGDALDDWPQVDFGIEFNDLDSIRKDIIYSFSLTPRDTMDHSKDPYFDFYGEFPSMHTDIESYMQDMQRMIDNIFNRSEDLFREFNEEEFHSLPPDNLGSDSIPEQPTRIVPQKYSGSTFNI